MQDESSALGDSGSLRGLDDVPAPLFSSDAFERTQRTAAETARSRFLTEEFPSTAMGLYSLSAWPCGSFSRRKKTNPCRRLAPTLSFHIVPHGVSHSSRGNGSSSRVRDCIAFHARLRRCLDADSILGSVENTVAGDLCLQSSVVNAAPVARSGKVDIIALQRVLRRSPAQDQNAGSFASRRFDGIVVDDRAMQLPFEEHSRRTVIATPAGK